MSKTVSSSFRAWLQTDSVMLESSLCVEYFFDCLKLKIGMTACSYVVKIALESFQKLTANDATAKVRYGVHSRYVPKSAARARGRS